jgi:hypothetical protein
MATKGTVAGKARRWTCQIDTVVSPTRGYRAVARSGLQILLPRARLNQHLAPDVSSTGVWMRNP